MSELSGGVRFNRPSLVAVLYLLTWFTGLTALVGVILAYIWRKEPEAEWENSHWPYLINTFWMALAGAVAGLVALGVISSLGELDFEKFNHPTSLVLVVGVLLAVALATVLLVRCIRVLVNAQAQRPMSKPGTLLF